MDLNVYLKREKLNGRKLADELGVDEGAISRVRNNIRCGLELATKIIMFTNFHVTYDDIFLPILKRQMSVFNKQSKIK